MGDMEMELHSGLDLKHLFFKAALSVVLGFSVAKWGIPYVYAQRGYAAVGGEYLLVLIAAALPFLVLPKSRRR